MFQKGSTRLSQSKAMPPSLLSHLPMCAFSRRRTSFFSYLAVFLDTGGTIPEPKHKIVNSHQVDLKHSLCRASRPNLANDERRTNQSFLRPLQRYEKLACLLFTSRESTLLQLIHHLRSVRQNTPRSALDIAVQAVTTQL
jgi:hypothetical protein